MSKNKPLSRNKSIKILHELTGITYKECRTKLKACNWDLGTALDGTWYKQLKALTDNIDNIITAIGKAAEAIGKAIGATCELARNAITEAKKEA